MHRRRGITARRTISKVALLVRAGPESHSLRPVFFGEELGEGNGGRERRLEGDAIRATWRCGAARRIFPPGLTARANLCRASGAGFFVM